MDGQSNINEFCRQRLWKRILLVLFMFSLSACFPVSGNIGEGGLSGTKAALDALGTQLAQQQAAQENATQIALSVQATLVAQQIRQLTAAVENVVTDLPEPQTATPTSLPPTATDTLEPTEVPSTPTPDFKDRIKSAEILLFEDVAGAYLERYVKQALDSLGLKYVDVKDAIGDFKAQLLSGTDWDLIITAVEARSGVRGEFFDYLNDALNNGSSVILEIWTLDEIAGGKISPLLARCGVRFQADWWDPPSDSRSIWWLEPEHPIFHEPNEGMSLAHYSIQWFGDAGDFIRLAPGGDATLLAGNLAWEKSSHGTLASCIDGRFILQTHSTHDYHKEDVIPLWQNYIYYALKNRFSSNP